MLYRFLMALSFLICLLPHKVLLWLGEGLGRLYFLLVKRQRELALAHMQRGLQLDPQQTRHLVCRSFVNLAQNMLEILYLPKLKKDTFRKYISFDGLEYAQKAMQEGHGVVILTGHIGTWEWLSAGLSLAGLAVTAIAKPQPNVEYTRALDDLRKTVGVEVFSRGTSELLAAGRALKAGKILGFLVDQDAGPTGAFIDFLGAPASTPMGAAVFSRKFKAPVVPAFILRQKDGRHVIRVYPPMQYEDTGDVDKDLYDFTARMTRLVEQVIREHPTQWLWFQHRWNTTPEMRKQRHHGAFRKGRETTR